MRFDVIIDSKFEKSEPRVTRQVKQPGTVNRDSIRKIIPVKWQKGERIPLVGPEEILVIEPPREMDFQGCCIRVKSKADVLVVCSDTHSHWEIRIPTSDDPGADAPATVNLTLDPDEPDN
jgi:hypothetical protein